MFDNLTNRLSCTLRNIGNRGRLTEQNIKETLREVRIALLEADVSLPVVRDFISNVRDKAINLEVNKSFTPGQKFLKIVHNELVSAMGQENKTLNLMVQPPATILIVGLQGVGKTTCVGKLGKFLHEQYKKKVLAVSVDIYRPAAIKQLEILTQQAGIDFFQTDLYQNPVGIVSTALKEAKLKFYDVLLIDTAGRMHISEIMINEIKQISTLIKPAEILFVIDAMIGQNAIHTIQSFDKSLSLTGVILTKIDGDTRGGVALSVRYITGKPIKFIGVGEKIDALEPFRPERIASRILGMGDVLSLIEDIERKIDRTQAEKLVSKLKKGDDFDLNDFMEQLCHMKSIGGISGLISKLPSFGRFSNNIGAQIDNKILVQMEAVINSMTLKERANPNIIKSSHKRRIAMGCGMQVQDINRILKQFNNMQRMMRKVKKGNGDIAKIMRTIDNTHY